MQAWQAAPRDALTEDQVRAALTFDHRVKVRHGVDVLSTSDTPTTDVLQVEGGDVTWSYRPPDRITGETTQVAAVRRQATLQIVGLTDVRLALRRFRLWTEILGPDGVWVRFWLGVFVATVPPTADDGLVVRSTLNLADKTYRYLTRLLTDTLVVPAATNCVQWVIDDLTSRFSETSFSIPSSTVTLTAAKVFESGTSYLDVYDALLETAAFDQLTTDEAGRPMSRPLASLAGQGPEITYGPGDAKIVTAGAVEPLMPTLPNQVRFVARQGPTLTSEGNGIRTVTNQSTGPASVDQSGETRSVTVEVEAENQTQLDAIAAADAQRYFAGGGLRFTGRVALNPRHSDRDVVELVKPRLGLTGTWLCTQWRYPMQAITDESAVLMDVTFEKRVA